MATVEKGRHLKYSEITVSFIFIEFKKTAAVGEEGREGTQWSYFEFTSINNNHILYLKKLLFDSSLPSPFSHLSRESSSF
ncbi:hypothetical protein ACET3Z_019476 [Daucus carota]